MEKVNEIINTVGGLVVKLLDFYSGLFEKGLFRTALGLFFLLALLGIVLLLLKPIAFLLLRPFLGGVSEWSASLAMQRTTEPGAPKPYVLHMRLSMRELFRKALADIGLYGRTDTDALIGLLVRRGRMLSEDANFSSLQGLVRRSDTLRKQSARYTELVRAIERERGGRLFQGQDYFAESSHLDELALPNHPGEVRKGFLFGLYAAMLFQSGDYHAFRNLLRSGSIRPEGTVMRFHTEAAREHFADRMERSLARGVPFVLFSWMLIPNKGLRLSVLRYLFRSAKPGRLPPLENERGPGYEVRFESEQGRQQASFRFEIVTAGPALQRRIQETGTHEIMAWAAGKAALEGLLLGAVVPVEAGSVAPRHLISEKYRLDNPYDRQLLSDAVCRFVAHQAETVVEREAPRAAAAKGGQ
jgi:hypothetical protein